MITEPLNKEDMLWHFVNKLGCQNMLVAYTIKDWNGKLIWSPWLNYFNLLHIKRDEFIPKNINNWNKKSRNSLAKFFDGQSWRKMTRQEFIDRVNQRSVLDCEIMIDIDNCEIMEELFTTKVFTGYYDLVYFDNFNKKQWYDMSWSKMYPVPVFKTDLSLLPKYQDIISKSRQVVLELKKQGKRCSVWFTGSKSYHISVIVPELRNMTPNQRLEFRKQVVWYYGGDLQECGDKSMISCEHSIHHKSGKEKIEVKI